MPVDFTSLLLATAFSGLCLCVMLVVSWTSSRNEPFMLTWAIGLVAIVAHVLLYAAYFKQPSLEILSLLVSALVFAAVVFVGAAAQFCHGTRPTRLIAMAAGLTIPIVVAPLAWGLDGVSLMLENVAVGTLLIVAGSIYFANRDQTRTQMTVLALLYIVSGVSFWSCGLALLAEGAWVIGHAPENWAEHINVVVSVACLSGAGAISLGLHHSRQARGHQIASLTDELTTLNNRRALFRHWGSAPMSGTTAVALFDIDHFKKVNDRHGHASGDEVLAAFGRVMLMHCGPDDFAARLGGEEFTLVMPQVTERHAIERVEAIRRDFADLAFMGRGAAFSCTVSAGIGWGAGGKGLPLDKVLASADKSLYGAKEAGRNRIGGAPDRLAS